MIDPGVSPGFPGSRAGAPAGRQNPWSSLPSVFPLRLRGFAASPVPSFREGKRLNKPPSFKAAKGRAMTRDPSPGPDVDTATIP
jgi:hypothetical protein